MVEKIILGFRSQAASVHSAAFLLGLFALLSQILGLVRDRMLALFFGASSSLDVYYAAFKIPDFLFVTVASLVSMSVIIPFIISAEEKSEEEGKRFVSDVFIFFSLAISLSSIVIFFFLPQIVALVFPGFSEVVRGEVVSLSKIILLSPILLGFSNLYASIAQAHHRFVSYAVAPLLYNLGIILGIVILYPLLGLKGLAFGVVGGALLHFLSQLPSVSGIKSAEIFPLKFSNFKGIFARMFRVVNVSIPRTIALASSSLAIIFLIGMGSTLLPGSIAIFTLAFNLQSVPLSIVGVSYSMAVFPVLSSLARKKEWGKYTQSIIDAAKPIIFWSIPASVFLLVFRAHIVRIVFGAGAFSWSDTRLTAASLSLFAVSLVFQSLSLLFIRSLYAKGSTKKAFISSLFGGVATILISYGFIFLNKESQVLGLVVADLFKVGDLPRFMVLALPLGFALGSLTQCILLFLSLSDKRLILKGVLKTAFDSLGASLILGFSGYKALSFVNNYFGLETTIGVIASFISAGLVAVVVWVAVLYLLKNQELRIFFATIRGRFWKDKPIVSDADPMA